MRVYTTENAFKQTRTDTFSCVRNLYSQQLFDAGVTKDLKSTLITHDP